MGNEIGSGGENEVAIVQLHDGGVAARPGTQDEPVGRCARRAQHALQQLRRQLADLHAPSRIALGSRGSFRNAIAPWPIASFHSPTPALQGAGLPLATLLQEPSLPVVPGFVIVGTGPIATDDATLVEALAEALSGIGSPREVAWQVQAPPEAPLLAPPTEVRAASGNAAALLRELASAAGDGRAIAVRAPRYAQVRGRAFSEDPREDRVDQAQVEAWRGDQPAGDEPAVIYRRDAQGDGIAVEQSEAGPALTTPQLARIFDYVETAEERLGEPVSLEWAVGSDGVWVTEVASIATPLPWGIERDPPQAGDGWTRANAGEIFPSR